jgi:hypothetical protein
MVDPFRSIIVRERADQAIALCLLVAFGLLAAVLAFWPSTYVTDGRVIEATVVRIGTYAVGEGSGGDLPILTVRFPNGSIRQVKASWSTAGNCMPGSHVSLLQRGTALQVTLRGCFQAAHPG